MAKGQVPPHAWKPGQSGNPGGRPRIIRDVIELSRQHTEASIEALFKSLADPRTRVAAAVALLERGWGKPLQTVESNVTISGGIDAPIIPETLEEWLARRHADLDAMGTTAWPAARRDTGSTSH
jgi:hypothetical protein